MTWKLWVFAVGPLVAMLAAVGYTAVATYRLRDWRPPLFVFFLVPMSVHQANEVATVLSTGSTAIVTGFGEYPETTANLTAALSVVLVLRLVAHQRALGDRLTERIQRERALRRENDRLDQFARIVSHDIRNPLNVAAGHLELAREDRDDEDLAVVADALDRMETILEETLALARQGRTVTDAEAVDVRAVATGAAEMVATEDLTLSVETEFSVVADRERLSRLFENLVRNAADHAGPDVTVRTGPTDDGFYVADDGPGIPEDSREEVFEPGHTTAADGNGFGLAIVHSIARAHGWSVRVDADDSGGARFEFTDVDRPD